jgi:hypothetical protein
MIPKVGLRSPADFGGLGVAVDRNSRLHIDFRTLTGKCAGFRGGCLPVFRGIDKVLRPLAHFARLPPVAR